MGKENIGILFDSLIKKGFLSQRKETSAGFNIFKALGIEAKEVLTCRFFGAILEPNGSHGLGTEPLRLFLKTVLQVEDDVRNASVVLEETIKDDRRVDIVIRNNGNVYPIEVKIKADDQDTQLEDYYRYYFGHTNGRIYYLTPSGWFPSKKSMRNLSKESVVCISFAKEIDAWFDKLKAVKLEPVTGITSIIYQYKEVISDMCTSENEKMTVLETLEWENGFEANKKTKALIELLALNGDKNGALQILLQTEFLRSRISFDENRYCYTEPDDEQRKMLDGPHARLYIARKNNETVPIASICIATNLYLACKDDKRDPKSKNGWKDDECWAYLHPDGNGKKFRMDDCRNLVEEKYNKPIDISLLLADITEG